MSRYRYVALVLLTFLVYLPALELGWIWDDDQYVTQNIALDTPSGLWAIWFVPGTTPQYYPLVFSTFWVVTQLFGDGPFAFHLLNVVLHIFNVILCYRILRQLELPYAFWVALAFGVHPIHVESVAWVTELKNLLSATFYGLAWLTLFPNLAKISNTTDKAGVSDKLAKRNSSRKTWALGTFFFVCGLLCKTVTATLPAAMLVAVWFRNGSLLPKQVVLMFPLILLGGVLGWNTARLEVEYVGAQGDEWNYGFPERLGIASRCITHYAADIALPMEQAFFYPRYDPFATVPALAAIVAVVIGMLFFIYRAYRGRRGALAGFLFFAGSAFPALGFLNVYPHRFSFVADHFVYIPSVGLIAIVVAIGTQGGEIIASRCSIAARRYFAVIPLVLWVVWLSLGTLRHLPVFSSEITLWEDTLEKNPECLIAMHNLAMRYDEVGRAEEALALLERALEFDFDRFQMLNTLGVIQNSLGHYEEAEKAFRESIKLEPLNPLSMHNLAKVLSRDAQEAAALTPEARDTIDRACSLYQNSFADRPLYQHAFGAGITSFQLDKFDDAKHWFSTALECKPDDLDALYQLALTHYSLADYTTAKSICDHIAELNPEDSAVKSLLMKLESTGPTP